MRLSTITISYLETALWAETVMLPAPEEELVDGYMVCSEGHPCYGIRDCEPLDKYFDVTDFTDEALKKAEADCALWFNRLKRTGLYERAAEWADDDHIVHDFWLTRNGHGAGYWDGDYGDSLGRILTKACKDCPEVNIFVGCDGKLNFG